MRDPEDRTKDIGENQNFRTLPEVKAAMTMEQVRVKQEGVRLRTRRGMKAPSVQRLMNWLVCGYLVADAPRRDEWLRRGREAYERLQASDLPIYFTPGEAPGEDPSAGDGDGGSGAVAGQGQAVQPRPVARRDLSKQVPGERQPRGHHRAPVKAR
jgi:hypothetical protein